MKNVAFIPVRGGSKSIPLKNIRLLCGKPLVYWTLQAACDCTQIEKVFVATDSEAIRKAVEDIKEEGACFSKIQVIGRSAQSATDDASTELAMLEFAQQYEFETIALIQATSPLLTGSDLDRGFAAFYREDTDSVLSVVPHKRFHWAQDTEGLANPVNYDPFRRPRRQDFTGDFVENGAFYITRREDLLTSKNRISGRIRTVEMCAESFFEIDEPEDWAVIEALMKKRDLIQDNPIFSPKMFLTDCDGCLTDGGMYYTESGDEMKKFNTKDGMAFAMLREKGILTGILTGESVDLTKRRAQKLRLDVFEGGCKDKLAAMRRLCTDKGIGLHEIIYVGDDLNDLEAIRAVGFGCCPADAVSAVKAEASFITKAKGGEGVIREIVEYLSLGRNVLKRESN